MKSFNSFVVQEQKCKTKGKKISVGKSIVKINPDSDELRERLDAWHPTDDVQDSRGGTGGKLRAKERASTAAERLKQKSKKLLPGESYMDYAKRHGYKSKTESAVPGKPAERVGALSNIDIPVDEREAAKQRTLAKAAALRKKREMKESAPPTAKAERQVKNIKKSYSKDGILTDKEKSIAYATAWKTYNQEQVQSDQPDPFGRPGGKHGGVKKGGSYEKAYQANMAALKKLDNRKVVESFSEFMEARRQDKEGVERGGSDLDKSIRAGTKERAAKAVEAVKKGDKRVEKYVKKYGTTPSKDTLERRNLKMMHPGSRQEPKVKGEKETAQQTHNRRVNRHNERLIKHGSTAKEKKSAAGYAEYEKQYKSQYGQHKSAWD